MLLIFVNCAATNNNATKLGLYTISACNETKCLLLQTSFSLLLFLMMHNFFSLWIRWWKEESSGNSWNRTNVGDTNTVAK